MIGFNNFEPFDSLHTIAQVTVKSITSSERNDEIALKSYVDKQFLDLTDNYALKTCNFLVFQ